MAPYKGQGLYDHVPPKLEPGNTLTDGRDPAPTLHTRSSNLLYTEVPSGGVWNDTHPPRTCHSGQGQHRLA